MKSNWIVGRLIGGSIVSLTVWAIAPLAQAETLEPVRPTIFEGSGENAPLAEKAFLISTKDLQSFNQQAVTQEPMAAKAETSGESEPLPSDPQPTDTPPLPEDSTPVPPEVPAPTSDKPALEEIPPEPGQDEVPNEPSVGGDDREAPLLEGDRHQLLLEADRLWIQGQYEEAELLYRKAKTPGQALSVSERPDAIFDPTLLPPAGQVYWREAEAGRELNLMTRMLVPLELLTTDYPEFIPGQMLLAQVLLEEERIEDALGVLEQAATLYPEQGDLVRLRVETLAEQDHELEASIAARQFSVLYPNHPLSPEMTGLAEEYLDDFQDELRGDLTGRAIANVLTGALGYALTGGLFGPFSAIQTTVMLLRGESAIGESVAEEAQEQLPIVQDPEVVAYVNELGERLAAVSGRDDFDYEFFVVLEPELNAFALPGGKIFVNAGAIAQTRSEAELAGLLAHEISHAVLSHGFELVTRGNLTANVLQFIPYGGIATDLAVFSYSRDMERQADALATRMLAASGYAADGLQNLMITLQEQSDTPVMFEWLSTHPDTEERVQSIATQIDRNGYNRYAYEGVERHREIQRRVQSLLPAPTEK